MSQRKAFNFYLSFFEVFEELPNDKEKLAFIKALLNKQFYGEEPNLSGIAKFAYISQKQVINQQVEGWENKTGTTLIRGVLKGGAQGGSVQEEGKGEVEGKVKEEEEFEYFWDYYDKKVDRSKCLKKWLKLNTTDKAKIFETVQDYVKENSDIKFRKNPLTYLNGECWNDELIKQKPNQETSKTYVNENGITIRKGVI